MIIYNPKESKVEFCYDNKLYVVEPKSCTDNLPEHIAKHALDRVHGGLVPYDVSVDQEMMSSEINYKSMPWRKLVSLAAARGVFKPGASKDFVIESLEEYDKSQGRTVQSPTS